MRKYLTFSLIYAVASLLLAEPVFAAEGSTSVGLVGLGAGLAIGLAAMGGGIGQGKAASAALDSIGRNPSAGGKVMVQMLIGLAFVESLVIIAFVIAIQLVGVVTG